MKDFFKSIRFKIIVCLLAFLSGIMLFAVTKGGYSISGVSVINTITQPFINFSNSISVKIENFLDKNINATEYYNENQRLRDEIGLLKKELSDYKAVSSELEEMKKFIGIKEENPDYVISEPCKVNSYTANDIFKSFVINKGSASDIKPYSPVVTSQGLIGITVEVSENTSTVKTILSPDLSIAVVCPQSLSSAVMEGYIDDEGNAKARLIHLNSETAFKVGDTLVTKGTGGLFPSGYPVGTVTKIVMSENTLSYTAIVEPCANLSQLSSIVVIKDFSGKESPDEN